MGFNYKAQRILKVLHDSDRWMTSRQIGEKLGYTPQSVAHIIKNYLEDRWVETRRYGRVGPYWKPAVHRVLPIEVPSYIVEG